MNNVFDNFARAASVRPIRREYVGAAIFNAIVIFSMLVPGAVAFADVSCVGKLSPRSWGQMNICTWKTVPGLFIAESEQLMARLHGVNSVVSTVGTAEQINLAPFSSEFPRGLKLAARYQGL